MKLEKNWRNRTLEALEKQSWGNPDEAPTNLVKRCILLSKVPVSEFSVDDLRLMIGQHFGLSYLVPIAIEKLTNDLFAEGDLYPGDLLENVLKVKTEFWQENKQLWQEVRNLIKNREAELIEAKISVDRFISVVR